MKNKIKLIFPFLLVAAFILWILSVEKSNLAVQIHPVSTVNTASTSPAIPAVSQHAMAGIYVPQDMLITS